MKMWLAAARGTVDEEMSKILGYTVPRYLYEGGVAVVEDEEAEDDGSET